MFQKNDNISVILALLLLAGILSTSFWWLTNKYSFNFKNSNSTINNNNIQKKPNINNQNTTPVSAPQTTFGSSINVPQGTTIKINGSTSMVQINQALKNRFEQQFAGIKVITNAQGTNQGIKLLQSRQIDLAAMSRFLTVEEQNQGLATVPIAQDEIAIVVGNNNSFRRSLTKNQVREIFQGKITNWSALGGANHPIKVINRPEISGTRQIFQEVVLEGENFGRSHNFITMERDATTPILRALASDGISYATYRQVVNQRTIRTVAIDGLTPEAINYPYQRTFSYAYLYPPSSQVRAFLEYVLSPQGQETIINTKN
ncbi:phosphate ABC transporter substrate-binding protein, PhoT family [Stanieria cyanosphaera PCC 7437]|uniref:Phosphate ABC transporter substrate-binding protein, PhoT family n=1 Tax=Stanieria cyanosphaera (strain ATCC 29371 / PCC 7437) TaxID=111780 RepID=K9XSG9_STAC7|nr:phosphate ABC transporter substrate-binding protein [Stanieria cyanosphaera]AFZ35016.1 phosphate ABC transporter substrate-binding protein, PhoT family [Stanieria cyanosphaera PCC 7437]